MKTSFTQYTGFNWFFFYKIDYLGVSRLQVRSKPCILRVDKQCNDLNPVSDVHNL